MSEWLDEMDKRAAEMTEQAPEPIKLEWDDPLWGRLSTDECQCFACKREALTGQGGDVRSYREVQARGTGRSGPFGGPDADVVWICPTLGDSFEHIVLSMREDLFVYGDSMKPQGPADIAGEDEPAYDVRDAYPKAAPDYWFQQPERYDSAITAVDAVGWPKQPPFFPQKTIITSDAIWRPAPDWSREAYFTDHLGERCFVTMSFLAHRSGLHDEWQAYVCGLPVREKNVECAGRYSTMEDAFAAALSAAQKRASEKFNVPVSENPRGDSPLVPAPESGCAHPGEAQREEPADELRRYLGRVCKSKKLEGI